MVKRRIWLLPLVLSLSFLPAAQTQATITQGVASYYAKRFDGRRTASGDRLDINAMTAAHRTLSFGTRVKVTNKSNGRSVEVTINDRGPHTRGRTIDLSQGAAREIGMLSAGTAHVELQVVDAGDTMPRSLSSLGVDAEQRMVMELF